MGKLEGKKIAILTEEGFEEVELTSPREALEKEGASPDIISPKKGKIRSWNQGDWNIEVEVNKQVSEANPDEYDGLLLPGGVLNPDKLRRSKEAVEFTKHFFDSGKPVAAICHGPQLLIETGALQGRKMTSFHSVKTDLKNAGARWEDREVVVDQGLTTSRSPDDLEAFNAKMLEEFAEGVHAGNRTL